MPAGRRPEVRTRVSGRLPCPAVAGVRLSNVSKRFGDVTAVDNVVLDIGDREFMVLLGPSGCGKSTLLRMIAGLEDPTEGEIWIGDQLVNDVAPKQRDIAMVFQSYALYPHKTVQANIEFPLKARGVGVRERGHAAREAAQVLGLTELIGRKPGALSGGQRQRVALARAIVRNPAVFLMDEPLSNLDAKLRGETRAELIALHQRVEGDVHLRHPRPGRGHDHGHPRGGHAATACWSRSGRRRRCTTARPASSWPSSSARRR